MFAFLRKKPASFIGLEINTDEIKLLQLCHAAKGYTIEKYAVKPLQDQAIVDDKMKRFDLSANTHNDAILYIKNRALQIAHTGAILKSITSITEGIWAIFEFEDQIYHSFYLLKSIESIESRNFFSVSAKVILLMPPAAFLCPPPSK